MNQKSTEPNKILVAEFLKTRSESDFLVLYHKYGSALDKLAMMLCSGDKDSAKDCLQDTWVITLRKLPEFEWRSSLKTWLTSILINTIKNKKWKRDMQSLELTESIDVVPASSMTSYDLAKAINRLPDGYKEILVLHDVEGYKHREIADIMKISEGTSKSQLYHARKAVRVYFNGLKSQEI